MLHAIGFPDDQMPQLLVHGWWNLGGAKMSKSTGNIVDPFVLVDKYSAEALRYYLMSDIATGKDADFTEERLIERYNSDLANSLGNLLNRTLNMTQQYRQGILKRPSDPTALVVANTPVQFESAAAFFKSVLFGYTSSDDVVRHRTPHWMHVDHVCGLQCNRIHRLKKPWVVGKGPDKQGGRLDAILYTLC